MHKCPCHSGKPYEECCKPYHDGAFAPNALALMRSRYSAYALGLSSYIMNTTHPDNVQTKEPRQKWKDGIELFSNMTSFDGLEILSFTDGEKTATVVFRAILTQDGKDISFTEESLFNKMGKRWLYRDAALTNAP